MASGHGGRRNPDGPWLPHEDSDESIWWSAVAAADFASSRFASKPSSRIRPPSPMIAQRHISGCLRSVTAKLVESVVNAISRVDREKAHEAATDTAGPWEDFQMSTRSVR